MTGLLLIGGGGHCKAAIDVIEAESRFEITGIIERPDAPHGDVLGYPVVGSDDDLPTLLGDVSAVLVTIGQIKSPAPRRRAFATATVAGALFPILVSPRAYLSRHAELGPGTLVMHGSVVNAAVSVGRNCILNSTCLVEHDARIGDDCHISTGAIVNGHVTVEDGCFIGSGAVLHNGITIGAGSVIGAGCVIASDVPPGSLVKQISERSHP